LAILLAKRYGKNKMTTISNYILSNFWAIFSNSK